MRPTGTRAIETTAGQRPPPGSRPSCRTEGAEPWRDRSPEACGARSGPGQVTQQKTEENPGKSENRRARRGLEATISGRSIGNYGGNPAGPGAGRHLVGGERRRERRGATSSGIPPGRYLRPGCAGSSRFAERPRRNDRFIEAWIQAEGVGDTGLRIGVDPPAGILKETRRDGEIGRRISYTLS